MKISFIIVNYRSEAFLTKCVQSLRTNILDETYEIVIVNNDSTNLKKENGYDFPNVRIINRRENDGFAAACNAGAKIAVGKFLFFLNPDTELRFSNIAEFISTMDEPGVGIVAPKLITQSGAVQPWSVGYEVSLWEILRNNFGRVRSEKLWNQDLTSEVDWVSGAALMISKKLFVSVAGFDEKFFMYFEDMDLCRRIRNRHRKILRVPHFPVLHLGGHSYSDKKRQKKQYYSSQDYYFKKNLGLLSMFFLRLFRSCALALKKL